MKRIIFTILISLLATASFAQVAPRDMKFDQISFDPAVPERFVTNNGIVVYFVEDHQLPILSLNAYFKGGEIYDPTGKTGLSELTATLMRTGGAGKRTPDQVDYDLEFVGTSIGSGSSSHNLSLSLRTLTKDIDLGMQIFSDIILEPTFDSAKFALEKSVMQDGIRRQNDDPGAVTRRVFYQTLYGNHPYGAYATIASLDNITRTDVADYYGKYYAPGNCFVALTGDLTSQEAHALIDKYFGSWKSSKVVLPEIPMAESTYKPGVYYAEKDINQANIRFGNLLMTDDNPDRFAFEIMNFALGGGGFSSRMMSQVRTTAGLAYSVGCYPYLRPLMGLHFSYCQTKAESMAEALTMMLDVINEVHKNGITEKEMELARESVINSYIFDYDTPAKLVNAYAQNELRGFPQDKIKTDLESYKAVTLEKCNRAAEYYLNTDNIVIIVIGNKDLFDKPLTTFGPVTEVSMEIK